jgi:hypothetical protein
MSYELLRSHLEQGYNVTQFDPAGTPGLAPTGEPYVVLQGVGDDIGAIDAFTRYAHGKGSNLYWRTWPEFKTVKMDGRPQECFYMRLLISEK